MKRILVIDDEEWLREMVHLALSQRGYEVLEAGNGASGIEVAQKQLPDLILCDVNMEKVDGYGTLSSLRNEPATAAIPFILMTGLADSAGMRHGMELGADDYLPKPFTIDALYAAVEARLKKAHTLRQEAEKKLADLRDNQAQRRKRPGHFIEKIRPGVFQFALIGELAGGIVQSVLQTRGREHDDGFLGLTLCRQRKHEPRKAEQKPPQHTGHGFLHERRHRFTPQSSRPDGVPSERQAHQLESITRCKQSTAGHRSRQIRVCRVQSVTDARRETSKCLAV